MPPLGTDRRTAVSRCVPTPPPCVCGAGGDVQQGDLGVTNGVADDIVIDYCGQKDAGSSLYR